jgi:predicted nucleic acid-binding protein
VTWLLDTNVVSNSVRDRPDPAISRWIADIPRAETAISIVTLAELWDGATSVSDKARRRRLMNWVKNEVTPIFEQRTLPLTRDVLAD